MKSKKETNFDIHIKKEKMLDYEKILILEEYLDFPIIDIIDYSKKENQIGCGYCDKEHTCKIRDPKINKAKLGCKEYKHFND